MPITERNLVRHELCGLKVKVVDSTDPTQKGIKGTVIDETYNTIKIETLDGKEKVIPKRTSTFIFTLPNKKRVEVRGEILLGRPEDRIKKKLRRW